MKNRFFSHLLHSLLIGGILASPLQATEGPPDGPPHVRNVRRTQAPPDITNIPLPDEKAKKCMLDAIALLIKTELKQQFVYPRNAEVFSRLASAFDEETWNPLPEDFALAIRTVAKKLDQLSREKENSYCDHEGPVVDEIVKNWLLLEAISRRDFGISLEWESMKAMWRFHYLKDCLLTAPEIIPEYEEIEKRIDQERLSGKDPDGKLWDEQFEIIARHIPPFGYQGTTNPETRKVIMDWYQKTVIDGALSRKSDHDFLSKLPDELQKLIKEELETYQKYQSSFSKLYAPSDKEKNHHHALKRQWTKAHYAKNSYLIDTVGITLVEYMCKAWEQVSPSKWRQKTDGDSAKEFNKEIRSIWAEWDKTGIPDPPFPRVTRIRTP